MDETLLPTHLPSAEWSEFPAAGFSQPVAGVLYHGRYPPVCGLPLGGIVTGCLDLEATGLLGYSSIFNSLVPRRGPLNLPFLGISLGQQTWLCARLPWQQQRAASLTYLDLTHQGRYQSVRSADEVCYWGHYPVAMWRWSTNSGSAQAIRAS